jgi:uncharacterized protein YndB with AHSA1/START domain
MSAKTDLTDAVVVERTLNAPTTRVWQALTDGSNAGLVFRFERI